MFVKQIATSFPKTINQSVFLLRGVTKTVDILIMVFNFTCTSCIICYRAAQTVEIFHILQLFLMSHNLYWGRFPWDSHYLPPLTFPFNSMIQFQSSISIKPCSTVCSSTSSTKSWDLQGKVAGISAVVSLSRNVAVFRRQELAIMLCFAASKDELSRGYQLEVTAGLAKSLSEDCDQLALLGINRLVFWASVSLSESRPNLCPRYVPVDMG